MSEAPNAANGRFRVVRPLAEGAFSRVFLAHDVELNRAVALKQLRDRYAREPRSNARLLFEAEITAGLEHPGVIPVYALGRHDDGRAFFTMRLIQGEDLKRVDPSAERTGRPARNSRTATPTAGAVR